MCSEPTKTVSAPGNDTSPTTGSTSEGLQKVDTQMKIDAENQPFSFDNSVEVVPVFNDNCNVDETPKVVGRKPIH